MTVAQIGAVVSGFGTSQTTVAADASAYNGKTVCLIVANEAGIFTSVQDSSANTWVQIETGFDNFGTSVGSRCFKCDNFVGTAAHTFTVNTTTGASAIGAFGIDDAITAAFDQSAQAADTTSPFGSGNTGVTAQAAEVSIGFIVADTVSALAAAGGYTKLFDDFSLVGMGVSYKVLAATGAQEATWTATGTPVSAQCVTATFKTGGGGGGGSPTLMGQVCL